MLFSSLVYSYFYCSCFLKLFSLIYIKFYKRKIIYLLRALFPALWPALPSNLFSSLSCRFPIVNSLVASFNHFRFWNLINFFLNLGPFLCLKTLILFLYLLTSSSIFNCPFTFFIFPLKPQLITFTISSSTPLIILLHQPSQYYLILVCY